MGAPRLHAAALVAALYDDPERCAELAKLRYVNRDDPGLRRLKRGRGFTYRDAGGAAVDALVRARIQELAIPPAWREVWICDHPDGHLLAVGEDERGRRQYIYHPRWRSIRDQLNFYRLVGFGENLPVIRADVERQLRRRALDSDRVLAAMLRIIDRTGLRVGNEVYAEENESCGLSTLTKRHVRVHGTSVDFAFRAKSGKWAEVTVTDPSVTRVIAKLATQRGRRLFMVAGSPVDAEMINGRLAELTGAHLTAKDFRTWRGTSIAFAYLRARLPAAEDAENQVLRAIDAAAEALGNTRTVARAHYVHPDVIDAYASGELERFLRGRRPRPVSYLDADERLLLPFLAAMLEQRGEPLAG